MKINRLRFLFKILFVSFIVSSCELTPKNEFQNNHNIIGIWSLGSIQYNGEELLGWVYINTIEFYDNDSIWLSAYPKRSFSHYGKYKMEFDGNVISEVEIITEDTLYAGIYDVVWKEYYTTPRARDSILSGVVLQSDKTLLWLNSRLTGWRK